MNPFYPKTEYSKCFQCRSYLSVTLRMIPNKSDQNTVMAHGLGTSLSGEHVQKSGIHWAHVSFNKVNRDELPISGVENGVPLKAFLPRAPSHPTETACGFCTLQNPRVKLQSCWQQRILTYFSSLFCFLTSQYIQIVKMFRITSPQI